MSQSREPVLPSGLRPPADDAEARTLLLDGEIDVEGRMLDASNVTLVGTIRTGTLEAECVYKPVAGERPLWDFPDGTLAGREVSAALVSEATGWRIVPPTVLREGPFGAGMVQLWVDGDASVDLAAFVRRDHPGLRRMAVFDAVVNNADRKGGHVLPLADGRRLGVDHGVTFHVEPKLRTVLWGWLGASLDDDERAGVARVRTDLGPDLDGDLARRLAGLLAPDEVAALARRCERLLSAARFPHPEGDMPAVPWPLF